MGLFAQLSFVAPCLRLLDRLRYVANMHFWNQPRKQGLQVGPPSGQRTPNQIALLKMTRIGLRTQDLGQLVKLDQPAADGYVKCEDVELLAAHPRSLRK